WKPAARAPVAAPCRIEVPRPVQAGVFGIALGIDDAGRDLHRPQDTLNEVGVVLNVAGAIREHEAELPLWTSKLPFLQRIQNERAERDSAIARFRFGFAD